MKNLTKAEMQSILDGAPDGATDYLDHCYYKESDCGYWFMWQRYWNSAFQWPNDSTIKLSDIRAELDSRQQLVDENVNDELGEQEGLDITYEQDSEKTCWIDDTEIAHAMSSHVDDYSHEELKQIAMAASVVINSLREQSVIKRFTNLAASFREIGKQYQTTHSIERDTWFAAAEYIERLKSERNEFRDLHIAEGAMVRDQDIELQKLKQQLDSLKAKVSEHNEKCLSDCTCRKFITEFNCPKTRMIDMGEHHE